MFVSEYDGRPGGATRIDRQDRLRSLERRRRKTMAGPTPGGIRRRRGSDRWRLRPETQANARPGRQPFADRPESDEEGDKNRNDERRRPRSGPRDRRKGGTGLLAAFLVRGR